MTLKEKFLISFFEGLMENDFEELYSEDTDYEGNVKTENLQESKEIISSKVKVYKEYLDAFCKEAGLDLDSDYNGNTELATELILKLFKITLSCIG